MGQVSSKLRRAAGAYTHWCPGCDDVHPLPDSWTFVNHDLEHPTFTPSFKHSGMQTVIVNGKWNGEWVRDADGKPVPFICHYILTKGILHFQGDCTHALKDKAVPLPPLPEYLRDPEPK